VDGYGLVFASAPFGKHPRQRPGSRRDSHDYSLRTNKTQPRQFFSVTFAYFRLGSNLRRCKTYGALSDPILYDKFSWNSFLLRRKNFRSERSNQANQSTVLWQQKRRRRRKKHTCLYRILQDLRPGSGQPMGVRQTIRLLARREKVVPDPPRKNPSQSHIFWLPPIGLRPPTYSCPALAPCFPLFVLLHTRARPMTSHHSCSPAHERSKQPSQRAEANNNRSECPR
jgi:hypothetical protein